MSSSAVKAALATPARSTTKPSVHIRVASCGVTAHAAHIEVAATTGIATTSQRPRSTAANAFARRIQVGSHWLLPWVAPAKVAATSVDSAT